ADLSRRGVLFDRHAAAGLAHGDAVQSDRVPGQRFSLEFLWLGRRRSGGEPRRHGGLPAAVPDIDRLDLPHRLSAQELTAPQASRCAESTFGTALKRVSSRPSCSLSRTAVRMTMVAMRSCGSVL